MIWSRCGTIRWLSGSYLFWLWFFFFVLNVCHSLLFRCIVFQLTFVYILDKGFLFEKDMRDFWYQYRCFFFLGLFVLIFNALELRIYQLLLVLEYFLWFLIVWALNVFLKCSFSRSLIWASRLNMILHTFIKVMHVFKDNCLMYFISHYSEQHGFCIFW